MTAATSAVAVAQAAAAAAGGVDGVVGLHHGVVGEVATYGGGVRVPGVRVTLGPQHTTVTVHVAARYGNRLPELADAVRSAVTAAVRSAMPGLPAISVDVHVAEVRASSEVGG